MCDVHKQVIRNDESANAFFETNQSRCTEAAAVEYKCSVVSKWTRTGNDAKETMVETGGFHDSLQYRFHTHEFM